jgi:NADH-quinone oxidoreductase subunit D
MFINKTENDGDMCLTYFMLNLYKCVVDDIKRKYKNIVYKKIQNFKGAEAEVYHANVPEYYLPPKQDVYSSMEALIWHFKIIMGEIEMPKGELYHSVEGANGELGYYLISDGGRTPYRLHFRRPCFIYYQAYPELIKGSMLSDAIVVMSSLNLIAGELDA